MKVWSIESMKTLQSTLFFLILLFSLIALSQTGNSGSESGDEKVNVEDLNNFDEENVDFSDSGVFENEKNEEIGDTVGGFEVPESDDIFKQLEALNSGGASFYESYKVFIYNPSNRKSPFLPPKNIRSKKGYKELEDEVVRTGLLAYDLESLKLTSLLWNIDEPRALIKDPTGQTYKVKEGVLIGRKDGYIAKIREGEIVVVEKELVRGEDGLEKEIFKTQVLKMER